MKFMAYCIFQFIAILFLSYSVLAQVQISSFPAQYQFFPRSEQNTCDITISGNIPDSLADGIGLICEQSNGKKDSQFVSFVQNELTHNFTFNYTLHASLNSYSFKLFGIKDSTRTLLKSANQICCGDVYLVLGQSNAFAQIPLDSSASLPENPFVRTFGRPYSTSKEVFVADTLWGIAKHCTPESNLQFYIGQLGFHFADSLVKAHGIPICVLNGSEGSTSIVQHQKSESSQVDYSRIYDRLMYRCQKSNLKDAVKGIIWYQGENDADSSKGFYTNQFTKLYKQWEYDFEQLSLVLVFQIKHGCNKESTSIIREEQRLLKNISPNQIKILSTMNIKHDGCHFNKDGYKTLSNQIVSKLSHSIYNTQYNQLYDAPTINQAVYINQMKIALVFDQPVLFDYTYDGQHLKDYFFNEKEQSGLVSKLYTNRDTVFLELNQPNAFRTISYTPHKYYVNQTQIYEGPFIYNVNSIGALTFFNLQVQNLDLMPFQGLEILENPIPSPSSLKIKSNFPYHIYDISGRKVDQDRLSKGIYIIRNSVGTTKKIVIQ